VFENTCDGRRASLPRIVHHHGKHPAVYSPRLGTAARPPAAVLRLEHARQRSENSPFKKYTSLGSSVPESVIESGRHKTLTRAIVVDRH